MFVFVVIAIAEVLTGFFIYEFFNPEKRKKMVLFKYGLNLDVIKKGNRIVLYFCMLSAAITLINGVLAVKFNFIDMKDTLLKITLIAIFPLRYAYIIVKAR